VIYLWAILVAVGAAAFFSAGEMAFIAANRVRMRQLAEGGSRTAMRYLESFRRPERVLSTAMMGVTLAHITAACLATWALLPAWPSTAPLWATALLTPLMLILGEVIPKAVARQWATTLIRVFLPVLEAAGTVLLPLTRAANGLVVQAIGLFGHRPDTTRQFVSREELKLLLQMEPEEADVTTHEAAMIDRIFDLGETTAREVMVPLADVVTLPETAAPDDAVRLVGERGYSRIPVYRERVSNLVGVVTAMDLLRHGAAPDLRSLMRACTYVPETKRLDELLGQMQKNRVQLAVVVDEYGAAVGVLTVEDIVEQIVGDIEDEHDRRPSTVERLPDGSYRVAGRVSIDELNEALGWTLPSGDYETVAGLALATVHRIPRVGEEFTVGRYVFTVLDADSRRVVTVRITPPGGVAAGVSPSLHTDKEA
jgi:putative hemolysin